MSEIVNSAQRTPEWYRARLGCWTGSQIGNLFISGKKKDEYFGKMAKTYIYKVAYERMLNEEIMKDDMMLLDYLSFSTVTSKSMQWGIEHEDMARQWYEKQKKCRVVEVSSIKHPTIPKFASSPDGFIYDENTQEKGCLEIKCPNINDFMKYRIEVSGNSSLKEVEPMYYYQCQAHIFCTKSDWCDFVVFSPFSKDFMHIVRIYPDKEVEDMFKEKIGKAEAIVNTILNPIQMDS